MTLVGGYGSKLDAWKSALDEGYTVLTVTLENGEAVPYFSRQYIANHLASKGLKVLYMLNSDTHDREGKIVQSQGS